MMVNAAGSTWSAAMSVGGKGAFDASVVSKTLDYMNQNQNSYSYAPSYNADYDFQTSYLSAAYTGKGGTYNSYV